MLKFPGGEHYQASSIAVRCSAAFSTKGTSIKPMKFSGTVLDWTILGISSTKKKADMVTQVRAMIIARMHSVNVSLSLCLFFSRSSLWFSSLWRTLSKIVVWLRRLNQRYLRVISMSDYSSVAFVGPGLCTLRKPQEG